MAILSCLIVKKAIKSLICHDSHQFLGETLVLKFRETAHFHPAYSADLLLISTDLAKSAQNGQVTGIAITL